jgi:hypothetical protein
MQQIAHFLKHTLRNYERCVATFLRASVKTTRTCVKIRSPSNGEQLTKINRRKRMDSLLHQLSFMLILNTLYFTNLNLLAIPSGRSGFNLKWNARHINQFSSLSLDMQHQHVIAPLDSPILLEYLHFHQITPELLKT